MIEISVRADVKNATRWLDDVQRRQVPFATKIALNNTAFEVQKDASIGMTVFDRPRSQTIKGIFVTKATKTDQSAIVGIKSRKTGRIPVVEYLYPNIEGGGRVDKRSEVLLKNAGVLPKDMQTRPGPDARLDNYGNMSRGQIVQIISYFKAFGSINTSGRGFTGNTHSAKLNRGARKNSKSFYVIPGVGVFQRVGKKSLFVLTFISPQNYPKRYDFTTIAKVSAQRRFKGNFEKALRGALETAR